jgi:hypothetical protein
MIYSNCLKGYYAAARRCLGSSRAGGYTADERFCTCVSERSGALCLIKRRYVGPKDPVTNQWTLVLNTSVVGQACQLE